MSRAQEIKLLERLETALAQLLTLVFEEGATPGLDDPDQDRRTVEVRLATAAFAEAVKSLEGYLSAIANTRPTDDLEALLQAKEGLKRDMEAKETLIQNCIARQPGNDSGHTGPIRQL
ncbi:hypothetical protein WJX73_000013 [Symbiochloris irregularis]|uniref:Mediator of RNA polymerase II transcription subunit 21 n=1 Tax=Symbiochloris irregularis TaxID=706552 RepID=A0AAW1PAW6_9CHLO